MAQKFKFKTVESTASDTVSWHRKNSPDEMSLNQKVRAPRLQLRFAGLCLNTVTSECRGGSAAPDIFFLYYRSPSNGIQSCRNPSLLIPPYML